MNQRQTPRGGLLQSRWLPWVVSGLTLGIFAATLAFVTVRLRSQLREQIAGREASVFHEVAALQGLTEEAGSDAESGDELGAGPASDELAALVGTEQLIKRALARLRGVVGARLYNAQGALITTFPLHLTDSQPAASELEALRRLQPVSRFRPSVRREELFLDPERNAPEQPAVRPLLEVMIPLRAGDQDKLVGITQLLLDGQSVAAEFAQLDQHLLAQAGGVFLAGGGLIVAGLGWALRRLQRANRLLSERTQSLLQANAELALAAKTSAVGAVTAHLIHGLKNPLSGLQSFVAQGARETPGNNDAEWALAAGAAQRMQGMIQEVVRVVREETGVSQYELSYEELMALVSARALPVARQAGVNLTCQGGAEGRLSNREANLVLLILENLIQNAIQATPRGLGVALTVSTAGGAVAFEVRDHGPGIPEDRLATLFAPGLSAKPGGTGIGLAISKQLANHLGAGLELKENSTGGAVFVLTLKRPEDRL